MSGAAVAVPERRPGYGLAMAVISATSLGAGTALSRLAYDHGTDPGTVLALRYLVLTLVLFPIARAQRRPILVPMPVWLAAALVGVGFCATSWALLFSVSYIPVSLTVLIFYAYPTLTLLAMAMIERRRPAGRDLAVVAFAFTGLAIALGVRFDTLHPVGVGVAIFGAFAATTSFVLVERALASQSTIVATAHATAVGLVIAVVGLALTGGPAPPVSTTGYAILAVVVALFGAGIVCLFESIRHVGAVRSAMLLCLEPISAIAVAVTVLGERPTAVQWLGAAMVVATVAVAGRMRAEATTVGERAGS